MGCREVRILLRDGLDEAEERGFVERDAVTGEDGLRITGDDEKAYWFVPLYGWIVPLYG